MTTNKRKTLRVGKPLLLIVAAQLWLMWGFAQATDCTGAPGQIDVMVLYTKAACAFAANASECGSPGPIEATIEEAVKETNTGFANSAVAVQVCLVFAGKVASFVEGDTVSADLALLKVSPEIRAARNQHAADLVLLITRPTNHYPSKAPCGLASQMPSEGDPDVAHAVVPQDCATGIYSFGHELGHIMGADHETELRFPADFNHGFVRLDLETPWRTVMAQNVAACADASPEMGCSRVLHWSNPNVKYKGKATGRTGKADNSQRLNNNAGIVANYR
jgi:hypothetical protein